MLKINYPIIPASFQGFCDHYYDVLISSNIINEGVVNNLLGTITNPNIDLKTILTTAFADLPNLFDRIENTLSDDDFIELQKCFNYDKKSQPIIAKFFSNQTEVKMESCFYCNMDNIYAFNNFGEYEDGLDFLNRAYDYELLQVPYILNRNIDRVKTNRPYDNTIDSGLSTTSVDWLDNYKIKIKVKNHFTLDHVLPKSKYKLLSLSLFNFVPSCSPCNTKFKGAKEFKKIDEILSASPSSQAFSINSDFEFHLIYEGDLKNLSYNSPIKISQLVISNSEVVNQYFWMFKIPGRYAFQKAEARRIIDLLNNYPDSKFEEIARITGRTEQEIKQDLFGEEIFNDELISKPLTKFKRDIFKNLGS